METKDRFQKILDNAIIAWTIGILALVIFCMFTSSCTSTASQLADSLVIYDEYYTKTEKLLDEIDQSYDWYTEYADSGKEEKMDYYWARFSVRNDKGLPLSKTLQNLRKYYQETQILLDILEDDYGWLDTVGEGDTYCEWCEILKKIEQ